MPDPHIERSTWIFEQFSQTPRATQRGANRDNLLISSTQVGSYVVSTQVAGQVAWKYFEARIKGSSRFYLNLSKDGTLYKESNRNLDDLFGLEIGRYFITDSNRYGRLVAEVSRSFRGGGNWVGATVQTGVPPRIDSPWGFEIGGSLRLPLAADDLNPSSYLNLNVTSRYPVTESINLGGRFTWFYRMREMPGGNGTFEHMQFLVCPFLEWDLGGSRLAIEALQRIWLDLRRAASIETTPTDVSLPDVSIKWEISI